MSRALLFAVLLLTSGAARATELDWRIDPFANEFWFIDQLSDWQQDGRGEPYEKDLQSRRKLDDSTKDALRAYARVRLIHAREPDHEGEPDVMLPTRSLFPPLPRPEDRFTIAFLTAKDEGAACDALKLTGDERAAVLHVFKLLRADIDALIAAPWLQEARTRLMASAREARMDEFLDRMMRFYAVKDDAPYRVHLLYAPKDFASATVTDHEVILPLRQEDVTKPGELESWLGVVVHEFGHAYLSQLPPEELKRATNLILNRVGLFNRNHPNVVDEATQTALGNIVFVRDRLPKHFDRRSFYSYEPQGEYPDAIDSLARAAEPLVSETLESGGTFADDYLPRLLDLQLKTLGNAPKHHAHVALAVMGSKTTRNNFSGLFWNRSRWTFTLDDLDGFSALASKNTGITRWAILETKEATPETLAALGMPVTATLKTLPKKSSGCAVARRRSPDGGFDFYVLAKDLEGIRKTLIALHRSTVVPETKRLCVP